MLQEFIRQQNILRQPYLNPYLNPLLQAQRQQRPFDFTSQLAAAAAAASQMQFLVLSQQYQKSK